MSANTQIISRLRSEKLDELQRLLRIYATDAQTVKLINNEIKRRQAKLST
ncbi:hypothetical protein [Hymenobacter wooponensis]|nr:hypothetical protein [Hymenobacter wooponensis]